MHHVIRWTEVTTAALSLCASSQVSFVFNNVRMMLDNDGEVHTPQKRVHVFLETQHI
jgi:hypothetical protein